MIGLGTLINVAGILAGGLFGLLFGKRLTQRFQDTLMSANGICVLFIGISACLAGAVCGDHCSPISDTTIMSSAGARCVHVNHVSTQLPYAITVAVISFVMFLFAGLLGGLLNLGFTVTAIVSLAVGVVATIGFLFVMKMRQAKA